MVFTGARVDGKTPGTSVYYDSMNNLGVVVDDASGRVITVIPGGMPNDVVIP